MTETIRVKLLRPGAKLPRKATAEASGHDIHACLAGETVRVTQTPVMVPTGLALEVPPELDAQLRPRSGLARQGVLSTFGTLDADYRGELMIALYATSPEIEYTVHDGDRIAQLVVTRLAPVRFEEADELAPTERGARGHGSTGR